MDTKVAENTKNITFRAPGCAPMSGVVKNPSATLAKVAARAARKMGLAGTFECLSTKSSEVIAPDTRLVDLPADDTDITLASELTPA